MPRKSKTEQELGFLLAYWHEVQDMERDYKVLVTLVVTSTTQKGVMHFRLSAVPLDGADDVFERRHAIQRRFPDGGTWSLAGFLWELSRRLHDQVAETDKV